MFWLLHRSFVIACLLIGSSSLATLLADDEPAKARVDLQGDPLPAGAIARLGTLRYRPEATFGTKPIFLLPDDKTLVVTEEQAVSLWDLSSGARLKTIGVQPFNIRGAAVSADGKLLALAGFAVTDLSAPATAEIRIIGIDDGITTQTFHRHGSELDRAVLAFTPDGKALLSSNSSGVFRAEEIASGKELLTHQFPEHSSSSFSVSPGGETIAWASRGPTNQVFLWDWKNEKEPVELKLDDAERRPQHLAFSPDGKRLLITDDHALPPEVWSVESGRMLLRLLFPKGKWAGARSASFTPDGKSIVVSGTMPPMAPVTHVWEATTGEHRLTIEGPKQHLVSSDSKRLIGISPMGVWDLDRGKRLLPADDLGHAGDLTALEFLPSGHVVTAGQDATIRVWDPKTMEQKLKLGGHPWPAIATSPDGRWIASAGHDHAVRLSDATTGREVFKLPGHGRLGSRYTLGFARDSKTFSSYGADFRTRTWDVETGKALADSRIAPLGIVIPGDTDDRESTHLLLSSSCYSPDGKTLIVSFGKTIHRLDAATGEELSSFDAPLSMLQALSFSSDGKRLLVSGLANPKTIPLPDGGIRHTSGTTRTVLLVDAVTGKTVTSIVKVAGGFAKAALSPDGKLIADASLRYPYAVAIHDVETGDLKFTIHLPSRPSVLTFSPDGETIATAHANGSVLVWDLREGQDAARG